MKLAEVFPAGTITVAGTEASELPLFKETVKPPIGAGESKVTVPVDVAPPLTVEGETANDRRVGGKIVNALLTETPPAFAVIVAIVWAFTELVCTTNVAVELPAGTTIEVGILAC